ncbi:MAG: hypothetical protein JWM08_2577 [Candidatus Angelobacter sp.]|nr:hypothetical protein [Candidatus Angelobacter sp.]
MMVSEELTRLPHRAELSGTIINPAKFFAVYFRYERKMG